MSTLHTASLFPSWKDEVNRRVAEHKSRRATSSSDTEAQTVVHSAPGGRGAQAAARVAARYKNAPSFSQMLADEARAAMRAAQVAQRAADDAHAAAQMVLERFPDQYVLAGFESGRRFPVAPTPTMDSSRWGPQVGRGDSTAFASGDNNPGIAVAGLEAATSPESDPGLQPRPRHEPEFQLTPASFDRLERAAEPAESAAQCEDDPFLAMRLAPYESGSPVVAPAAGEPAEVEPPQPIPANLIQFPREMVAARRLRPRRVEGPLALLEPAPQLSIFEVDPAAVSTQPSVPVINEPAAPEWMRPEWPAIELEPQPQDQPAEEPTAKKASGPVVVGLSSLSRRLLAVVVDGSLTLAASAGVVALAAWNGGLLRGPRAFEVGAALTLLLVSAAYQTLFFSLTKATPGMWYAGIGLCTIDGYIPSRAQRWRRLLALPLSVLPLGLGLAWSLWDEDHLTWHDRLSGTYLRRR